MSVSMVAQNVFIHDLILCGDSFDWKCSILSLWFKVGGQAMVVISGSRSSWYHLRYVEGVFFVMLNSLKIE